MVCSIIVNSTGVYKLRNTLVGQLWLIISGHVMDKFQFHYSVAYCVPVQCKNWGIISNLKRIRGSFLGKM